MDPFDVGSRLAADERVVTSKDAGLALLALADRHVRCALQPIVHARSGALHAVAATVVGQAGPGAASAVPPLEALRDAGVVAGWQRLLQRKAIAAFRASGCGEAESPARLVLGIDGASLAQAGDTLLDDALAALPDAPTILCWRLESTAATGVRDSAARLHQRGVRFTAAAFASGRIACELLLEHTLDYIEIHPHLITGVAADERRKLVVSSLCRLAHMLGLRVIGCGVADEADLLACRQLGCDFVQGSYVAGPQIDGAGLRAAYPHVATAVQRQERQRVAQTRDRREGGEVRAALSPVPHLPASASIGEVFDAFLRCLTTDVCVVVDAAGAPLGTIAEAALRGYAYNPYGRDLLRNRAFADIMPTLMQPCPSADVGQPMSEILDAFLIQPRGGGVIITEAGRSIGMLSAAALLTMSNERRVDEALDRNPLTRLPGNTIVADRIAALCDTDTGQHTRVRHLCYFDFDNFKPFNDSKGFRQGDRAIVLFAEVMRRWLPDRGGALFGHLGGDDFVGVFQSCETGTLRRAVQRGLAEFAETVAGLYAPDERAQGWSEALDRYGTLRRFALLRCSAAVIEFLPGEAIADPAALDSLIAGLKATAKASATGLAWHVVGEATADLRESRA